MLCVCVPFICRFVCENLVRLSFVFSFYHFSWDRPGRMAKGSLQRAAIARTAAGKRSKCTPP